MVWTPPTQAEVDSYFERLNNWGRWGKDDQHGTLNLITLAKREAAMRLARRGRLVSLARDLTPHPNLDYHMLYPGYRDRCDIAMDYFGLVFHGTAVTHIDALCHVSYDGRLYNNRAFDQYLNSTGASWGALDPWFEGGTTLRVFVSCHAAAARWQHGGSSASFGDFLGQVGEGRGHEYTNTQNRWGAVHSHHGPATPHHCRRLDSDRGAAAHRD